LEEGTFIPIQSQPLHAIYDGLDRFPGGPGYIGILDTQDELSPMMSGKKPVEECRPCAPNMQETRRAGWKAGSDLAQFLPHLVRSVVTECTKLHF
jgi:hypothetical protein